MIDFLIQFQLSFFAIFSLTALLISVYYKEEVYSYSNRIFKALVMNMILILSLEVLSWAFDGVNTQIAYVLNYGFNFLLIIFSLGVPGFWASYIDYKIHGSRERIKYRLLYMHGFIIVITLAIVNFFVPVLFSINSDNLYSREPGLWFGMIYTYGLFIYMIYLVIKNRAKVQSNLLYIVIGFLMIPALGAFIQMTHFGIILMWPGLAIAVIIAYLFLETSSSTKDYLTGLYNRTMLDHYALHLIDKNNNFSVVMIDLDDYKKINDEHGHYTGDRIIIMFGKLLKTVFPSNSMVSRYGGDEFLVIVESINDKELLEYKNKIKELISNFEDELFQKVTFSYGSSSRTNNNNKAFERLITEADDLMYADKAANKNFKRRKSDR